MGVVVLEAIWAFAPSWDARADAAEKLFLVLVPLSLAVLGLIPAAAFAAVGRFRTSRRRAPNPEFRAGDIESGTVDECDARERTVEKGVQTGSTAESSPEESRPPALLSRRAFLSATTAALPLAGLGTGALGFAEGLSDTRIRPMTFRFPALPPDLEGLRILQLSDLHLGCTKHVRDVERTFHSLAADPPDLVVFTGDIAEDVRQIVPTMKLARELQPRLGVFAILGNHEYFRLEEVMRELGRCDADLLIDEGRLLEIGAARLSLAGVDDPISMRHDLANFYPSRLERAFRASNTADFRLLLSHRPEAIRHAATRSVDLTLAGHTHGGQIGLNGKSAFEPLFPDGYLWGHYTKGASQLYTTSGYGDWFSFRLGCRGEAPLITLAGA